MAKKIVLENMQGEIERDADVDHIKPGVPVVSYNLKMFRKTDRVREDAVVYEEWEGSYDPIFSALRQVFEAGLTTDSTDTERP